MNTSQSLENDDNYYINNIIKFWIYFEKYISKDSFNLLIDRIWNNL